MAGQVSSSSVLFLTFFYFQIKHIFISYCLFDLHFMMDGAGLKPRGFQVMRM